jgi:hypothetical protein
MVWPRGADVEAAEFADGLVAAALPGAPGAGSFEGAVVVVQAASARAAVARQAEASRFMTSLLEPELCSFKRPNRLTASTPAAELSPSA